MSRYIAKKAVLSTMQECKQPGCGCFTQKGYYIQYQNSNVNSMLFVCESCYEEKFQSICSTGNFDEDRYIVKANTPRYQLVNPVLRNLIRWVRKTVKTIRVSMVVITVMLVSAFVLKEQPKFRTEWNAPHLYVQLDKDVHFAVHGLEKTLTKSEAVAGQITKVFTHGGKENG